LGFWGNEEELLGGLTSDDDGFRDVGEWGEFGEFGVVGGFGEGWGSWGFWGSWGIMNK